jgi:hypothetical protein
MSHISLLGICHCNDPSAIVPAWFVFIAVHAERWLVHSSSLPAFTFTGVVQAKPTIGFAAIVRPCNQEAEKSVKTFKSLVRDLLSSITPSSSQPPHNFANHQLLASYIYSETPSHQFPFLHHSISYYLHIHDHDHERNHPYHWHAQSLCCSQR